MKKREKKIILIDSDLINAENINDEFSSQINRKKKKKEIKKAKIIEQKNLKEKAHQEELEEQRNRFMILEKKLEETIEKNERNFEQIHVKIGVEKNFVENTFQRAIEGSNTVTKESNQKLLNQFEEKFDKFEKILISQQDLIHSQQTEIQQIYQYLFHKEEMGMKKKKKKFLIKKENLKKRKKKNLKKKKKKKILWKKKNLI